MIIRRTLATPRRVRRIAGPIIALHAPLTAQAAAVSAAAAAEPAAPGYEPALVIDDFSGQALTLSGVSGPTTVQGGLCLVRTGEITDAGSPAPVLTVNDGDSGRLLWSDGSGGVPIGTGYVEWTCTELADLTDGGAYNAIRLKITDCLVGTGNSRIALGITDNTDTFNEIDYGAATTIATQIATYGVAYVDWLLAAFVGNGIDVTDAKSVRVTLYSQTGFLHGTALFELDEVSQVCSGVSTAPDISDDGAGGPLDCPEWLLLDDFTGDTLHVDDSSAGPDTGSNGAGLCGSRSLTNTYPYEGMEADIDGGTLKYHDGADGRTTGSFVVQWGDDSAAPTGPFPCGPIDITDGGAYNAIRITFAAVDVASSGYRVTIDVFVRDSGGLPSFSDDFKLSSLQSTYNTYGVAYADIVFPTSSPPIDFTDVVEVQLACSNAIFGTDAYFEITRIEAVCSGNTAGTAGLSTDGAGGPNNGTC